MMGFLKTIVVGGKVRRVQSVVVAEIGMRQRLDFVAGGGEGGGWCLLWCVE